MFLAETDLANVAFVFSFVLKLFLAFLLLLMFYILLMLLHIVDPTVALPQTLGMGFWKPMQEEFQLKNLRLLYKKISWGNWEPKPL